MDGALGVLLLSSDGVLVHRKVGGERQCDVKFLV